MNDPKAAATYHPGDGHVTRPDLDALIARLREWADHQDVPAPASNAIDEAVDALAAERARADQAEQRIADSAALALEQAAEAIAEQRDSSNTDSALAYGIGIPSHASGRFLGKTVAVRSLRARAAALRGGPAAPTAEQGADQ